MVYTIYMIVLVCYSLYSTRVIYALFVIAWAAIIYVDTEIVKFGACVGVLAQIIGHIIIPGMLAVAQEESFDVKDAFMGDCLPQIVMFLCSLIAVFYSINRSLETIDFMIMNNENLRISSEGFHKILVSSQTMLNANNYSRFIKKTISSVKNMVKFLNNSDERVKVKGVFIDQNGVYNIYNKHKGGNKVKLSIDGVEVKDSDVIPFTDDTDGK